LTSRRVLGRAITACTINACTIKACAIRQGLGSLRALQAGLVSGSFGWQYDAGVGSGSPQVSVGRSVGRLQAYGTGSCRGLSGSPSSRGLEAGLL